MTDRDSKLLLGTRKGLLIFEDAPGGPRLLRQAHPGVPVAYAERDPRDGVLWACLDHGHWGQKLCRSEDLGETWKEVPCPRYPEGAVLREDVPATLRYLWVWAAGGDDRPGRVYLGTEPGGLFRSEDGGKSFELIEGLWNHPSRSEFWMGGGRDEAGIHSIFVDPRDSARVLVGVSVAGVFETTDDGATWSPRNEGLRAEFLPDPAVPVGHDPHFVEACPADPDVLWQQNHCGIWRSVNGGASWKEISEADGPACFGFAIAADEHDPETAWVVPAVGDQQRMAVGGALCVSRTRDGGASWTALRAGLPQERAFDVVYRHALDLCGERLAFGSTSGNVYLGEEGGESWTCLGSNFPPVYSVRWAR